MDRSRNQRKHLLLPKPMVLLFFPSDSLFSFAYNLYCYECWKSSWFIFVCCRQAFLHGWCSSYKMQGRLIVPLNFGFFALFFFFFLILRDMDLVSNACDHVALCIFFRSLKRVVIQRNIFRLFCLWPKRE